MIIDYMGMLRQFHDKYDHYSMNDPGIPPIEIQELRFRLIDEEVNEELLTTLTDIQEAYKKDNRKELRKLIVKLADDLGDSLYVLFGTALAFGLPMDEIFNEIQKSNMTKSNLKNKHGKSIKGDGWQPPNIEKIIFGD